MRPVLLEMDGFASFRQKTEVDFDDVDYFALVGPTGAGKSTVLDAIAFALYGCVARWDDARAVEPALAPTVNRGKVRLVFDARGARYIVLRELRRNTTGRVQQKVAQLERLVEPTALGAVDDDVELVAGTIAETARAVEDLLGLDFNQFTKCVALPQGEFAEFLHAKPSDRDKILTKLLGLDIYLTLGRIAGARGSRLGTRADTLQSQLDRESAGAGDDAVTAAKAAHTRLVDLTTQVDSDVAALVSHERRLHELTATLTKHDQDITALHALTVPADADDLDAELATAQATATTAAAALDAAEKHESTTRGAVEAHPPRATLQRWTDQYTDQQRLQDQVPGLVLRVSQTDDAKTLAFGAREAADSAVTTARTAEATARAAAETAEATWRAVHDEATALTSVTLPPDLSELLTAISTAHDDVTSAATAATAAREAHRIATEAADTLPDAVTLDRAVRDLSAATTTTAALTSALAQLTSAHATARTATESASEKQRTLTDTERAAEAGQARAVAAELRAGLHEGDPCPVCEQTVHVVPDPAGSTDLTAATQALNAARDAARNADLAAARADAALGGAVAAVKSAATQLAQAHASASSSLSDVPSLADASLPDEPDVTAPVAVTAATSPAELTTSVDAVQRRLLARQDTTDDVLTRVTRIQAERSHADQEVTATRTALDTAARTERAAHEAAATLAERVQSARAALRRARDPLVTLGAPELDDADLSAAWTVLTTWATTTAAVKTQAATAARAAAGSATETHQRSTADLAAAQTSLQAAQSGYDAALHDHENAAAEQTSVTRQLDELTTLLSAAPPPAEVRAALTVLADLESQAAAARTARITARDTREAADQQLRSLEDRQRTARTQLAAARDPLVALGAPALPDNLPLAEAWGRLRTWAAAAAADRQEAHAALAVQHEDLHRTVANREDAIRGLLTDEGIDGSDPRPVAVWAAAAVAGGRAAAEATVRDLEAAQERCAALRSQIRTARADAHVATELAGLLAINKFPRWLTVHALDVLVTAASSTLMELSGGQFELVLGDDNAASFSVVDHTDADAVRPVKTLSGGETFQASLALALALSTHLGALSSSGAAQLEAIFIDEGFGTLDETTLDTVATTLETLATGAGRMVGVITHVPALAARVPVRFAVQRDPRGSTIERFTS